MHPKNIAPINPEIFPQKGTHKTGVPKQAGDDAKKSNIEVMFNISYQISLFWLHILTF